MGRTALSVSRNGTLAWLQGDLEEPRSALAWVDRAGRLAPLTELAGQYQSPRLSPDGRRIAMVIRSGVMTRDIRVLDAARPERVLLTLHGGDNHSPVWRPDGRRLTFASNRDGPQDIYEASLDGGVEKLIPTDGSARNPTSWSRRTPVLAFYRIMPDGARDILAFRPPETLSILVATPANERSPALSEDGRWLAYVSDESGRDEVYVQGVGSRGTKAESRIPNPEKRRISMFGGVEPLWTKDGLLYRDGAAVILTPFGAADGTLLEPRLLFERRFQMDSGGNLPDYDVSRDGQRLLMLKSARHPSEIRVVRNWSTELTRTVPP
jgi:dipeptidyl aminopeptidase/acylaminoacyl peptidase